MPRLARAPLLAVFSCLVLGLMAGPAGAGLTTGGPLRAANDAALRAYRFDRLHSCQVGDALSVVENSGPVPLRLDALSLLYGGDSPASAQRVSFELVSFRRGTFAGQLADTFHLTSLDLGAPLGPATGASIAPLSTSGRWYALVADVSVVGNHPRPWSIRGLGVSYTVGAQGYTRLLTQSIRLPATSRCR